MIEADTDPGSLRQKIQALKCRIASDRRVLDRLQGIPQSGAAKQQAQELRAEYERARTAHSELLETALEQADQQLGALQKENQTLQETVEQIQYKLGCAQYELKKALGLIGATPQDESESTGEKKNKNPGDKRNQPKGRTGKRGAPKGHPGRGRPVPKTADLTEVIPPPAQCPCGCQNIEALTSYDSKYIEDIPPVSRVVTHRMFLRGRCSQCHETLRHAEALQGPPVIIGPNLAVHLTLMNQMGTTFRKLSMFSTKVLGIELSPSGVLGLVNRVGKSLEGSYGNLRETLHHQSVLNGDETGWKVMGKSGYIWCFCNKDLAYFHHDECRAASVIEKILGSDFSGTVICDFYAAYNCLEKTQRCLVHLLRDIKKEREVLSGSKLLERFDAQVKAFIEKGLEVQPMDEGPEKTAAIAEMETRLNHLSSMPVTKGKATTLQKRITKYRDDLIRFVTHPDVEFHNNRAERQLRPLVICRKISFGSNTHEGALRHCIIHSIIETCKLQNQDPFEYMRRAYTSGGLDVPDICSPPAA